jgi:hypothetical protein
MRITQDNSEISTGDVISVSFFLIHFPDLILPQFDLKMLGEGRIQYTGYSIQEISQNFESKFKTVYFVNFVINL